MFDNNIYVGKTVVKLEQYSGKVTTGDTYKYLFIPNWLHITSNWISTVEMSFNEEKLFNSSATIESADLKKINGFKKELSKSVHKTLYNTNLDQIDKILKCIFAFRTKYKLSTSAINQWIDNLYLDFETCVQIGFNLRDLINMQISYYLKIKVEDGQKAVQLSQDWFHEVEPDYKFDYDFIKFIIPLQYENIINGNKLPIPSLLISEINFENNFFFYVNNIIDIFNKDYKLAFFLVYINNPKFSDIFQEFCNQLKTDPKLKLKLGPNFISLVSRVYNTYASSIPLWKLFNPDIWYKDIQLRYAISNLIKEIPMILNETQEKVVNVPKSILDLNNPFSLKQLISYVFKNDDITFDVEKLKRIELGAQLQNGGAQLQILEIAVDASTSKSFLEATMTELVQNSMDAIRSQGVGNPRINFEIGLNSDNKPIISITDYVGMTIDNIKALSIPFYSNKVASNLVTGEMGTGFFNIYRGSELVVIETVKNGNAIIIKDVPIRKGGRIQDIEKNFIQYETKEKNKTKITFVIDSDLSTVQSIANYYIYNVIGYMNLNEVHLNSELIVKNKTLINYNDDLEIYLMEMDDVSFVFTKGVPFSTFENYFGGDSFSNLPKGTLDFLSSGIILNMKHGFYTPVQSRTRLNISDKNKKKLYSFIEQSLYKIIIYKINKLYKVYFKLEKEIKILTDDYMIYEQLYKEIENSRTVNKTDKGNNENEDLEDLQKWKEEVEKDLTPEEKKIRREKLEKRRKMFEDFLDTKPEGDEMFPMEEISKNRRILYSEKAIVLFYLDQIFPGFKKSGTLSQVIPSSQKRIKNLKQYVFSAKHDFIIKLDNKTEKVKMNMVDFFKICQYIMKDKFMYEKVKDKIEKEISAYTIINEKGEQDKAYTRIYFQVMEYWLANKNTDKTDHGKRVSKDELKKYDKDLITFGQKYVDLFISKATESGVSYPKLKVTISKDTKGVRAFYNHSEGVISICTETALEYEKSFYELMNNDKYYSGAQNVGLIRDNDFYLQYLGVSIEASTLPHELEHSRRRIDHDDTIGTHGDIIYGEKSYTFDECANMFLEMVVSKGFYQELFKEKIKLAEW